MDTPLSLVAVCNTQWTGEAMWMAPRADPADGLLDVLVTGLRCLALYHNEGDLRFRLVTESAGLDPANRNHSCVVIFQ